MNAGSAVIATSVALTPSLEIRDVEESSRRLLAAFDGSAALRVDVSPVVTVDSAGVQLLLALRREAQQRSVGIEFVGKSAALDTALAALGLAAVIREPAS